MTAPSFFIVSSGRSGTTLLRAILNSHPGVVIPHESSFIATAWPYYGQAVLTERDYPVLARLFRLTTQGGWGMSDEEIITRWVAVAPEDLRSLFGVLLDAMVGEKDRDKVKFGIKRPSMIFNVGRIWEIYPEAKVIHVVRDGRDVRLSYKNVHEREEKPFGPGGVASAAIYWQVGLKAIHTHRNDTRMLEVCYEDLLGDADAVMGKICKHIEVDQIPDLAQTYSARKEGGEVLDKHSSGIHSNVMKGLIKDNSCKYKSKMGGLEISVFEILANRGLRNYGYPMQVPSSVRKGTDPCVNLIMAGANAGNHIRCDRREKKYFETARKAGAARSLTGTPVPPAS